MVTNFQRIGSISNSQVGRDFEAAIQKYFDKIYNIKLQKDVKLPVGVGKIKKEHSFDLGSDTEKMLIECKSHTWTSGGNIPSAKLTVWNEAMYYFFAAPSEYDKKLFVRHDYNIDRGLTLGQYYIRSYSHLIPDGVEIWEYDEVKKIASKIKS